MKNLHYILIFILFSFGCEEAKKNDRALAERLNNEAIEQMQKQNFEEASTLLQSAIDADDSYAEPHAYLIQIHLNEADFDAALTQSEIVIEKAPQEAENWVLAGILTEKKGNKEKAFSYYKESIDWFQKRLEEQKENMIAEEEDPETHDLPLQDEVNVIFSYILLEEINKANALIEELEVRYPNNAMIENLYDFDKDMYMNNLFPEME